MADLDGDGFVDNWKTARFTLAAGYADVANMKEQFRIHDSPRSPGLTLAQAFGADDNNVGGNNHGLSLARNMPSTSGAHTLQDVYVFGEGPGSEAIRTSMENGERTLSRSDRFTRSRWAPAIMCQCAAALTAAFRFSLLTLQLSCSTS